MKLPLFKSMAGDAWLEERLRQDEAVLPEAYERPLKVIKERSKTPFQNQASRYGILTACFKAVAP